MIVALAAAAKGPAYQVAFASEINNANAYTSSREMMAGQRALFVGASSSFALAVITEPSAVETDAEVNFAEISLDR